MKHARSTSALPLLGLLSWLSASTACAQPTTDLSEAERLQQVESMFEGYQEDFPEVPAVTVEELETLTEEGSVTLVDVRPAEERAVSMIPGAISSEELEENLDLYRDTQIVTYCTIGYRSGIYAEELAAKGIRALNLEGSILAWTHAGKPLVNADGETYEVHVYGQQWALTADGYKPVW